MIPNPLEELTLEQLRSQRTSMKWRAHPADVLPLWVAEMDVKLPPTVADALRRAIDDGDTGYPYGTEYAEAVREFACQRWQWHDLEVSRTAIVPDVMLGIVEVLRLITDRGDPVIVNSPVYAPFYAFVSHDGRRVIPAPLRETAGSIWTRCRKRSRARVLQAARAATSPTSCAIRTTRRGRCTPPTNCAASRNAPNGSVSGWCPTRFMPLLSCPGHGLRPI